MEVYILIGAPGSGKSTWSKSMEKNKPNIVRLCPDDFRAMLGTSEDDQSVSHKAFQETRTHMDAALASGKSVIIDATNMHHKARKDFLKIAKKYNAKKIAIVFEHTLNTLIERNKKRGEEGGRIVPIDVIERMINNYQVPTHADFDDVIFISKLVASH